MPSRAIDRHLLLLCEQSDNSANRLLDTVGWYNLFVERKLLSKGAPYHNERFQRIEYAHSNRGCQLRIVRQFTGSTRYK